MTIWKKEDLPIFEAGDSWDVMISGNGKTMVAFNYNMDVLYINNYGTWRDITPPGTFYYRTFASGIGTGSIRTSYNGNIIMFVNYSDSVDRDVLCISRNSGYTWSEIGPNLDINYYAIDNLAKYILVGEAYQIYYSSDFGQTWTGFTTTGYIEGVYISPDGSTWFITLDGSSLLVSTNHGQSWHLSSNAPFPYDTGTTWMATDETGQIIYRVGEYNDGVGFNQPAVSRDRGATWTLLNVIRDNNRYQENIVCSANGKIVLYCGYGGPEAYLSTNSGISWEAITTLSSEAVMEIAVSASGNDLIIGTNYTYDYGLHTYTPGHVWTCILGNFYTIKAISSAAFETAVNKVSDIIKIRANKYASVPKEKRV